MLSLLHGLGGSDKSLPMDMGKIIGEYLCTVVTTRQK